MAMGESRQVLATDMNWTVAAAAERGGILCAASGLAAAYNTNISSPASGLPFKVVPIGMLLEDVESLNPMLQPQYYQRNVSDLGSKVGIATMGEFVTDFIDGYAKPHIDAGDAAYLTHSGLLTIRELAPGVVSSNPEQGTSGIVVGRFLSSVDSNGFARVLISIP